MQKKQTSVKYRHLNINILGVHVFLIEIIVTGYMKNNKFIMLKKGSWFFHIYFCSYYGKKWFIKSILISFHVMQNSALISLIMNDWFTYFPNTCLRWYLSSIFIICLSMSLFVSFLSFFPESFFPKRGIFTNTKFTFSTS